MSSFDDSQRSYMLSELNRAIPVGSRAADMSTIQAALGTMDAGMPAETRQVSNALRMFSTFGGASSEALQRDAACRSIPAPSTSMRPDAGARAGCGWWYVPNPTIPSVGAYGTRRGPMNPNLGTQIGSGQWIWDPAQATQMEGAKAAAQIQACPDIQYAQSRWPTMGWCTQTNMAIITDGQGNPMYPRMAGGDCAQGSIVMSASACPPPPTTGGQPATPPPSSISGACGSGNAPLTPACLQNLATYTCSGNGALAQAYGGGGWPAQNDQVAMTNQVLMQRGFTLPTGVMQDGQIAVQDALSAFSALKAATVDPSMDARGQGAAANLCLGSPFDPCNFQPTDTGPFPSQCIAQTALGMGYAQNAGLMPSNIGMNYWNTQVGNTWSDVVSNLTWWKQTADTPQPQQPSLQANAVANVYGVNMKFPVQGCNINGAMVYRYYFPPGAESYMSQYYNSGNTPPATHFLGRYLLTQGLDQGVPNDMNEITPGNDQLTEIKQIQFIWTPAQGGIYRFLVSADDNTFVYFNGQLSIIVGNNTGFLTGPNDDIDPGVPINVQIVAINVGGPWNYQFTPQTSSDGGNTFQAAPVTLAQMNLPYDRRLPMLEWAFHKMQPTNYGASQLAAGVSIADTNNVMSQMSITANIGQLNGRQCLLIGGAGQGLVNYGQQTLQGIRLMAMKSFTMMLCITSVQDSVITPGVLSLYNLPTSKLRGSPNPGAWNPQFVQTYWTRTNSFDIMATQSTMYPFGAGPLRGTSTPVQTYLQDAVNSGNSITAYPSGQWFHYAWVWDADGTGYTIYLNGKQVGRGFMAPYDPQLIMEMFRLGCDQTADRPAWTGGIQWFRAFDYRLSQAQITTDMQDNWANGLS